MKNAGKLSHIKAMAFDLDGTLLLPDKTIGERTRKALSVCTKKGIRIILATGRGVESVEPYRKTIGAAGPHVYYNGAEVVTMPSGEILHAKFLGIEAARFCLELARKHSLYFQAYFPKGSVFPDVFSVKTPGLDTYLQNWEALLMEKPGFESEYYRTHSGLTPEQGDLDAAFAAPGLSGIIKCMFITEETLEKPRRAILERFGDSLTVVRSSPIYLEVLAKGVSKGAGLVHALTSLAVAHEDTIAFGDEENDLPMFAAAGFSAAPENAIAAVREAADFHIPSNADEGIASFLEEQILG